VLLVALGIALGLFLFHRTGYSPGGIITPGFLAMELASPGRIAAAFGCALVVAALLSLLVRRTGLYGRQRTGAAMLLALGLKVLLGDLFPAAPAWIGWVVPGLIGADMQRQGIVPTVASSLASAFAASLGAALLFSLSGVSP
jgi:poly-gamma-glutamate biosynthesis protein PgsC/CapC